MISKLNGPEAAYPSLSRRRLLWAATMAGIGALGIGSWLRPSFARGDRQMLSQALQVEDQLRWTYTIATGKLSNSSLGKAVLKVALQHQQDHQQHRDALITAVETRGGSVPSPQASYDLSAYLDSQIGSFNSDAEMARLLLALEYDAVLSYQTLANQLQPGDLRTRLDGIALSKMTHITALRSIFHDLDPSVAVAPTAFVSADTRDQWILKA